MVCSLLAISVGRLFVNRVIPILLDTSTQNNLSSHRSHSVTLFGKYEMFFVN